VLLAAGVAHAQGPGLSSYRPVLTSSKPTSAQWVAPPEVPSPQTPVARSVVPVRYQTTVVEETQKEYQIQLEPPGLERIARLDSDETLQERIKQETRTHSPNEIVIFPEEPILSRDRYYGRRGAWQERVLTVEPYYVSYGHLYFQDLNAERYGWDLGPIHPLICTAKFYYDLAMLPIHITNDPCGSEASTGYCLPGDPVPFTLYPPEVTVKGTITEMAVILALVAIFP
jgi:hypothetical protein